MAMAEPADFVHLYDVASNWHEVHPPPAINGPLLHRRPPSTSHHSLILYLPLPILHLPPPALDLYDVASNWHEVRNPSLLLLYSRYRS